ncbi:MAG: hypothetical protein ISS50_03715 [Anaerolineae bacterium]|nr:hypothetical protein [Anaerolineae bacterium]
MSHKRSNKLLSFALLGALLLTFLVYHSSTLAQGGNALEQARHRAQEAGSYGFTADAEQVLIPRPVPEMIGKGDQRVDWRITGEVELPSRAYTHLQIEGTPKSVTLIQDEGNTFLIQGDKLTVVSNPAELAAPGSDFLGYLAAAQNVQELEPVSAGGERFTRYRFELNGERFAQYVRAEMERQLRQQGELPPSVELSPPSVLRRMSGQGELWVDAAGLPRRQILDLEMPRVSQTHHARQHIVVDFRDFGQVDALPTPVQDPDGTWRLEQSPVISQQPALSRVEGSSVLPLSPSPHLPILVSPSNLVLFQFCLFAALLIQFYRRYPRRVYAFIAIITVISLLTTPLLRSSQIVRFFERRAHAASADPIAEALGLELTADDSQSAVPNTQYPIPNIQYPTRTTQSNGDDTIEACGDGSPYEDNDEDGLSDFDEGCYGTDPYEADTDQDMITDTLEVEGFDFGGRTWTADPFQPDSNHDGVPDVIEWPEPVGGAPEWDPDGDGIPNLWDDDNDGDGVPDQIDLSTYSVTDYGPEFSFSSQRGGFDGYQYIEIQVQPQNLDHLRYTTTPLDWPDDDQGQIQDLNESTEDLVLVPMLDVRTNVFPDEALRENYGLVVMEEEDQKRLLVPLHPEGTQGSLSDFYAKVPYGPGDLDDIQWESVKLVWMVQAQLDQYVGCVGEGGAQCVETTASVIQQYYDTFRVTGLQVTKSKGFELALFGTPESPTEDQPLFNVLYGISMTFLNYQKVENQAVGHTTLQEIAYRFAQPNTPITYTWGVTTTVVSSRVVYEHRDEALATSSDVKVDFLETHYPSSIYETLCSDESGAEFECAAVIFAIEEGLGVIGLEEVGTSTDISVNLADVPLSTERGLQLSMFERVDGDWEMMGPARMMEVLEHRYEGRWEDMLEEELQPDYPNLITQDLRFGLYLGYLTWHTGQTRTVEIGELALMEVTPPDEAALVTNIFGVVSGLTVKLPSYVLLVSALAGAISKTRQTLAGLHGADWQGKPFKEIFKEAFKNAVLEIRHEQALRRQRIEARVAGIYVGVVMAAQLALSVATLACGVKEQKDPDKKCNEDALKIATQVIGWMQMGSSVYGMFRAWRVLKGLKAAGKLKELKLMARWKTTSTAWKAVAVIGLIIGLVLTWVQFGLITANTSSGMVKALALAGAFAAMIWALLMFVLLWVPYINILIMIFSLVDLIVSLVFMALGEQFSISGIIIGAIADFFVDVKLLTKPAGVQFTDMQASLADEGMGYVVGNRFTVLDMYEGTLKVTDPDQEPYDDICEFFDFSYKLDVPDTWAEFRGIDTADVDIADKNQHEEKPWWRDINACRYADYEIYKNPVGVEFKFTQARPNVKLEIENQIHYELLYVVCDFFNMCDEDLE